MKHHGKYETQTVFDIGVGVMNCEADYVNNAVNQLRSKHRNEKRKVKKTRKDDGTKDNIR